MQDIIIQPSRYCHSIKKDSDFLSSEDAGPTKRRAWIVRKPLLRSNRQPADLKAGF